MSEGDLYRKLSNNPDPDEDRENTKKEMLMALNLKNTWNSRCAPYPTGEIALYIEIGSTLRRETLMIASCWVPGIPDGCVAVKDFAENRGCLAALTNAGAIDDPHEFIGDIPICRVLFCC